MWVFSYLPSYILSIHSIYDTPAQGLYVRYDHNNNEMRFRVTRSDKVTIASDGDVGIGTKSRG